MADDQDDYRDELPHELDPSAYVGPYTFPDNKRRRVPGLIYIASGLGLTGWFAAAEPDSVVVNRGTLIAGIGLVLFGAYCIAAAYPLKIDQMAALASAGRKVGFAVGHASAQLGWRGLRSRPTWRILLYSADEPPSQRGLVLVDGVDGTVVDSLVEANPEDWT